MHNFYMWHGGTHYGNWSQSAPPWDASPSSNGPVSSTNTVRYANAAPLHSDGTRNEPLWSHIASLHAALAQAAPTMLSHAAAKAPLVCALSTPTKCTAAAHFSVAYADATSDVGYTFALNTITANATIVARVFGGARLATLPARTVLLYRTTSQACDLLFNSSAPPSDARPSPIVPIATPREWATWQDDDVTWMSATVDVRPEGTDDGAVVLLDLHGLGAGRVWVNGWLAANYNLALSNCSVPRMPRCGATPVSDDSPDGTCGQPSQRYYLVPPEAFVAGGNGGTARLLLRETRTPLCCANHAGCHPCNATGPVPINVSSVRLATRQMGGAAQRSPETAPSALAISSRHEASAVSAPSAPSPSTLRAGRLTPLRVGATQPRGWLHGELTLQARGLTG
jgi:hypothetical protein